MKVQPGSGYMTTDKNGNTVTVPENIVDVRLYFQSTITGEIHGEYSVNAEEEKYRLAWDAATNTAKLTIREFKPDAPELYTYGDVLMAELITDRQTGVNKFMDWVMVYQPVSTGFAVIADQDYVPTTFNYDVNIAEMLDTRAAIAGPTLASSRSLAPSQQPSKCLPTTPARISTLRRSRSSMIWRIWTRAANLAATTPSSWNQSLSRPSGP